MNKWAWIRWAAALPALALAAVGWNACGGAQSQRGTVVTKSTADPPSIGAATESAEASTAADTADASSKGVIACGDSQCTIATQVCCAAADAFWQAEIPAGKATCVSKPSKAEVAEYQRLVAAHDPDLLAQGEKAGLMSLAPGPMPGTSVPMGWDAQLTLFRCALKGARPPAAYCDDSGDCQGSFRCCSAGGYDYTARCSDTCGFREYCVADQPCKTPGSVCVAGHCRVPPSQLQCGSGSCSAAKPLCCHHNGKDECVADAEKCQGQLLECHHGGECPTGSYCQRNGAGQTVCTFEVDVANAFQLCTKDAHCPPDVCLGGGGKPKCGQDAQPMGPAGDAGGWSARTCDCGS